MNYSINKLKLLNIANLQQPNATYWLDLNESNSLEKQIKKLQKDPLIKDKTNQKVNPTKMQDIFNLLGANHSVTQISKALKIAHKLITYHLKKAAVAADHLQVVNGQLSYRPINQRKQISDPVYIVSYHKWLKATLTTKAKEQQRKIHQNDHKWHPVNDLIKTKYQQISSDLRQKSPSIQQITDVLESELKLIASPHLSTYYRWIKQEKYGWNQTHYAFRAYKKPKPKSKPMYKKTFNGNFQTYQDYHDLDDPDRDWLTWQLDTAHGKQSDHTWVGVLTHQMSKTTFTFKSAKNPDAFQVALENLLVEKQLEIKYMVIDNGSENTKLDQISQIKTIYRTYPNCPTQKAIVERMIKIIRCYDGFGKSQSFDLLSDQDCIQLNYLLQNRKFTYQGSKQRMTVIQYQQLYYQLSN